MRGSNCGFNSNVVMLLLTGDAEDEEKRESKIGILGFVFSTRKR